MLEKTSASIRQTNRGFVPGMGLLIIFMSGLLTGCGMTRVGHPANEKPSGDNTGAGVSEPVDSNEFYQTELTAAENTFKLAKSSFTQELVEATTFDPNVTTESAQVFQTLSSAQKESIASLSPEKKAEVAEVTCGYLIPSFDKFSESFLEKVNAGWEQEKLKTLRVQFEANLETTRQYYITCSAASLVQYVEKSGAVATQESAAVESEATAAPAQEQPATDSGNQSSANPQTAGETQQTGTDGSESSPQTESGTPAANTTETSTAPAAEEPELGQSATEPQTSSAGSDPMTENQSNTGGTPEPVTTTPESIDSSSSNDEVSINDPLWTYYQVQKLDPTDPDYGDKLAAIFAEWNANNPAP